jgi:hypothetical protein
LLGVPCATRWAQLADALCRSLFQAGQHGIPHLAALTGFADLSLDCSPLGTDAGAAALAALTCLRRLQGCGHGQRRSARRTAATDGPHYEWRHGANAQLPGIQRRRNRRHERRQALQSLCDEGVACAMMVIEVELKSTHGRYLREHRQTISTPAVCGAEHPSIASQVAVTSGFDQDV